MLERLSRVQGFHERFLRPRRGRGIGPWQGPPSLSHPPRQVSQFSRTCRMMLACSIACRRRCAHRAIPWPKDARQAYAVTFPAPDDALYQAAINTYDLVIPRCDDSPATVFEVLREPAEIRDSALRHSDVTRATLVEDRITGLDHGADDVPTPNRSNSAELLARLRALLRRR